MTVYHSYIVMGANGFDLVLMEGRELHKGGDWEHIPRVMSGNRVNRGAKLEWAAITDLFRWKKLCVYDSWNISLEL